MPRSLALLCLTAITFTAVPAGASVYDTFGFEPRGVALGGAEVASARDASAAWANPALLALQTEFSFGLALSFAQPGLTISPLSAGDASRLHTAANPPDSTGVSLGLVFPLGGKVANRLALGVQGYFPTNSMLRTEGLDPTTPFWYRYRSSLDRFVLVVAAGLRVTNWLQLGAGAQFLGGMDGATAWRYDPLSQTIEKRSLKTDLGVRGAPVAGASVALDDRGLRFGVGFRAAVSVDYVLPTAIEIVELTTMVVTVKGLVHYAPHTFTLGGQYVRGPLTATAELRYALWSAAPDPATEMSVAMDGELLRSLGLDDTFDSKTEPQPPGFRDTLEPHVGVEYRFGADGRYAARAGYFFRPTPVPKQDEDTNILDSNTHGASVGLAAAVKDPLEIFEKPVHFEVAYQRLFLAPGTATKGPANPVPSYEYRGGLNHLTAAVRYAF